MWWLILGLPLFFVALGFLLNQHNAPYLLSGYRSMSSEEQAAYPLAESVRFFRRFHWLMGGGSLLIALLFVAIGKPKFATEAVVVLPLVAYAFFVYRMLHFGPVSQRPLAWVAISLLFLTATAIMLLFWRGEKPNLLQLHPDAIEISGMYGLRIEKSDIDSIGLANQLPLIRIKVNGYAANGLKKGDFRTKDSQTIRLFIHDKSAPSVYLRLKSGRQIFYQSEQDSLLLLYEKLKNWENP